MSSKIITTQSLELFRIISIKHPDTFDNSLKCCHFKNRDNPVFPDRSHNRLKVNSTFSQCKMGIFLAFIVMEVIVSSGNLEEPGKTMILMCMAHVQCKRGVFNEGKFARGF